MIACLTAIVLSLSIATATAATLSPDWGLVAEVKAIDQRFNHALEGSDIGTLEELIGDSYVFTDPTGRVSHKKELLDGFATRRIKIKSQTTQDLKIDVYSNAVVETGVLTSVAVRDGHNTSGTFRFTRIWVKTGGRWQTVAFQETSSRVPLPVGPRLNVGSAQIGHR